MTSAEVVEDASESSPLLGSSTDVGVPLGLKRRITTLLYTFAFLLVLGDTLQQAALIQIFEYIICADYYNTHPLPPASNNSASQILPQTDRCKAHAVQKELALVRSVQQLVPLFAGLLCAVPYGLLAERIGRKRVLFMSNAGIFCGFSWMLAVCYWRFASIRWVWLSGVFLFIGGGETVTSSILHVMITDTVDQGECAQIFQNLHASAVISGFFGPAISAALMEKGHVWTVLLLTEIVLFTGTFLLLPCIPETLNLSLLWNPNPKQNLISQQATVSSSQSSVSSITTTKETRIAARIYSLLAPLLKVLKSNRQALLLLCIFGPQAAARELFSMVGLQYSRAKFSLSYSRGNVFISLFQGTQGLFVLVFLPLITRFIADPRGWTPWARDRLYSNVAISVTALGLMVIAIAPLLAIEAVGLLLVAIGSCCTPGLLMSLLGRAVRPSEVSAVYSVALMLGIALRSLMGPISGALLIKGMELGWNYMGLPFAVVSLLMAGVTVASMFISPERIEDSCEE